mgnify:CR=1 FL=1
MKTPEEIFGVLFIDLNKSGLWSDAKAIADAIPKYSSGAIVEAYEHEKTLDNFDLLAFANEFFEFPEVEESGFKSDTSKSPKAHIETLWDVLQRSKDEEQKGSSLIPLPHPYIVPGGRFGEIYYWDCYLNSSYHFKEREFIQLKLIENGEEANEQNIQEEYIKQGYNFVEKSLKNDKECENYRWLEEYSNNQVYIEPSNEFEVCSACQESPCLCSDRERTSTIHDF